LNVYLQTAGFTFYVMLQNMLVGWLALSGTSGYLQHPKGYKPVARDVLETRNAIHLGYHGLLFP
jgi:hypothetical protein